MRYISAGGYRLRYQKFQDPNGLEHGRSEITDIATRLELVYVAIGSGHISSNPISEIEIEDHSKAGAFAKTISMIQMVFFAAGIITRLAQKLPVTLLEVGIVAFTFMSMATMWFYFEKPKAVNIGTVIEFENGHQFYTTVGKRSVSPRKGYWSDFKRLAGRHTPYEV